MWGGGGGLSWPVFPKSGLVEVEVGDRLNVSLADSPVYRLELVPII